MTNLVLTRRAGEAILIGDDIEIILLESHGSGARILVRAPAHVNIVRAELRSHEESAPPTPTIRHKRRRLR